MDPLKAVAKGRKVKAKLTIYKRTFDPIIAFLAANWWKVLIGLLLFLLAYLVYRWYKRRKDRIAAGEEQVPRLAPNALVNIWKAFLSGIPSDFRRSISRYSPFIVLGPAGAGKSSLIDNYTDWRGQARQFYPSYTADPRLQIYLGSALWAQELPHGLLEDTSPEALKALQKLWKPLFPYRKPHVVVVLDGEALPDENPEQLRRRAQLVRGKLNILSQVLGIPIEVSVALTHMDRIRGFSEFSKFLRDKGISLHIPVGKDAPLGESLHIYEDYLGLALSSLETDDYLRILGFLRTCPGVLGRVDAFVRVLGAEDPLSTAPKIGRICLCSNEQVDKPVSNPFHLPGAPTLVDPLRKHKIAAAVLAALGAAYLFAGFIHEQTLISRGIASIENLRRVGVLNYEQWRSTFSGRILSRRNSFARNFLVGFLPDHDAFLEDEIHRSFVRTARGFLYQYLGARAKYPREDDKIFMLLGVIYGTSTNDAGRIVMDNSARIATTFGLPRSFIEDYVRNNTLAEAVELPIDPASLDAPPVQGVVAEDWASFFRKVGSLVKSPIVGRKTIENMREDAVKRLDRIDEFDSLDLSSLLQEALLREKAAPTRGWHVSTGRFLRDRSLRALVRLIAGHKVVFPGLKKDDTVDELVRLVRIILSVQASLSDSEFSFTIAKEPFRLRAFDWIRLIDRTRITMLLRDFIRNNDFNDGLLFFRSDSPFAPIAMNTTNEGKLFFSGKGLVDGRFTRKAFDARVRPVLALMPGFMKQLREAGVDEGERFGRFMMKETTAYANRYAREFTDYWKEFRIRVDTLAELRYVVEQVALPTSHFQAFVRLVKENTVLDLDEDNEFTLPVRQATARFSFLGRLLYERKGAFPEFEKYLAIIEQLGVDLGVAEPPVAEEEGDEAEDESSGSTKKAGEEDAADAARGAGDSAESKKAASSDGQSDESGDKGEVAEDGEAVVEIPKLRQALSPAGLYTLEILERPRNSYYGAVSRFLDDAGIKKPFRAMFLGPVTAAYSIGMADLNRTIEQAWDDMLRQYIRPLSKTFPFDLKAKNEASPGMIFDVLNDEGVFWKSFRGMMGPVCVKERGRWKMRPGNLGSVRPPPGMLALVNGMVSFARRLWNDKGEPRPIELMIRTFPLPPVVPGRPSVVLAYLRAGQSTVFAFNQRGGRQKLKFAWWEAASSAAGMKINNPRRRKRSYAAEEVIHSDWSLYRLLNKADVLNTNLYSWSFKNAQTGYRRYTIKFKTESDPFSIFRTIPFRVGR